MAEVGKVDSGGTVSVLIRARAPLRLGLAGGGTDVSPYCEEFGGAVLNATIGYYAYAELREHSLVNFVSMDLNMSEAWPAQPQLMMDGNLDIFKAVYNHVVRKYNGGKPFGVSVTTRVDVPCGSGLGASSALVVAILKAFAEWLGIPMGEYDLAYEAWDIERNEAGLQGGKQDQYAAAFGGFNFMEFGKNGHVLINPLRVKDWIVCELESSLVLYFTGSSRSSAKIIEEQTTNFREGKSTEAMHSLKAESFRMKELLLKGNFGGICDVLRSGWKLKSSLSDRIVSEEIQEAWKRAIGAGAYCGKISGAGGGGFMMFLVDPMHKDRVSDALKSLGGSVYGCQFTHEGATAWRVPW